MENCQVDCAESEPKSAAPDTSCPLTLSAARVPVCFCISAYLARLLPGAHRPEQPLDLHLVLRSLFAPITQKVLQHPFFLLQVLAQLLGYLTLTGLEFAE